MLRQTPRPQPSKSPPSHRHSDSTTTLISHHASSADARHNRKTSRPVTNLPPYLLTSHRASPITAEHSRHRICPVATSSPRSRQPLSHRTPTGPSSTKLPLEGEHCERKKRMCEAEKIKNWGLSSLSQRVVSCMTYCFVLFSFFFLN
ncbi:unnamed protein product [Vicia faba]|uniref:Uncharacterized protein n=1 Tax=Vicia faba TaxID=3906 RepID=A0AAV0Z8T6_VICFA|nr:unnamed protein product [Vicia faba]